MSANFTFTEEELQQIENYYFTECFLLSWLVICVAVLALFICSDNSDDIQDLQMNIDVQNTTKKLSITTAIKKTSVRHASRIRPQKPSNLVKIQIEPRYKHRQNPGFSSASGKHLAPVHNDKTWYDKKSLFSVE
ncbi:hypothetical protein SK128_002526 [Halocaridina rubra]|uniref:Uncharacterized protein n=1 Tax=Halocaridina rubra TaxID=373956 RepID=A0AAN9A062_HALRR